MWEIPHSYSSDAEEHDAIESYVNIQIEPKRRKLDIPIVPEIGEILADTRRHPAFRNFQETWAAVGLPEMQEAKVWAAYESLVEAFAEITANKVILSEMHPAWHLVPIAISLSGHIFGLSWMEVLAVEGFALLGPKLSHFVRSVAFTQRTKNDLLHAVEIRSNKVS